MTQSNNIELLFIISVSTISEPFYFSSTSLPVPKNHYIYFLGCLESFSMQFIEYFSRHSYGGQIWVV